MNWPLFVLAHLQLLQSAAAAGVRCAVPGSQRGKLAIDKDIVTVAVDEEAKALAVSIDALT